MKQLIKLYMVINCIDSIDELVKSAGLKKRTLYDRFKDPKSIRVYEIAALDDVLHFSDEDLNKLVRGKF